MTTADIVAKLWRLCNILKDDGVTYPLDVTLLTYLLFLKMAQETGTEDQLPAGYRWAEPETRAAQDRYSCLPTRWLVRLRYDTRAALAT